jgi:hypothetical protein
MENWRDSEKYNNKNIKITGSFSRKKKNGKNHFLFNIL